MNGHVKPARLRQFGPSTCRWLDADFTFATAYAARGVKTGRSANSSRRLATPVHGLSVALAVSTRGNDLSVCISCNIRSVVWHLAPPCGWKYLTVSSADMNVVSAHVARTGNTVRNRRHSCTRRASTRSFHGKRAVTRSVVRPPNVLLVPTAHRPLV